MNKFRKKPVVIEAVRYLGNGNVEGTPPEWLWKALENGTARFPNGSDPLMLYTLESLADRPLVVSPGDWIIRGVQGELYPCKPDIFAATYEPVHD